MQNSQFVTIINREPGYFGKGHNCSIICKPTDAKQGEQNMDWYVVAVTILIIVVAVSLVGLMKQVVKFERIKFKIL